MINSKGNAIVNGKLVQPAIFCRVSVWPATQERLLTPALNCISIQKFGNFWKK